MKDQHHLTLGFGLIFFSGAFVLLSVFAALKLKAGMNEAIVPFILGTIIVIIGIITQLPRKWHPLSRVRIFRCRHK